MVGKVRLPSLFVLATPCAACLPAVRVQWQQVAGMSRALVPAHTGTGVETEKYIHTHTCYGLPASVRHNAGLAALSTEYTGSLQASRAFAHGMYERKEERQRWARTAESILLYIVRERRKSCLRERLDVC